MSNIELAIDFGSSFVTIYQKGIGLILREPTMALAKMNGDKLEISEVGYRAERMSAEAFGGAKVVTPIKEGIVTDVDMCAKLLDCFFKKILRKSFFKPKISVIVLISSSMVVEDRKNVEKTFLKLGIKDCLLVESPLALLSYTGSIGGLFVDIGSGKTEIAGVTNRGIVAGCTVNIAGNAFNYAIIDFLADNYDLKIGEYTVEKLKKDSLSLYENDKTVSYVTGRNLMNGAPKNLKVKTSDLCHAVLPRVDDLCDVVKSIMAKLPPELSAEVLRKGLFVAGGSSVIPGLKERLAEKLGLIVTPLEDVESAVAIGGGQFLSDKKTLSDLLGMEVL